MGNNTYLQIGKIFFAIAILAIGIVHLITGNFPSGLYMSTRYTAAGSSWFMPVASR